MLLRGLASLLNATFYGRWRWLKYEMQLRKVILGPVTYSMPLVFTASAAAGAIPAASVLGWSGAVAFGALAGAWLLFGRVIVLSIIGSLLSLALPRWGAIVVCSVLVDGAAIYQSLIFHSRLLWSVLAVVMVSEAFYLLVWWYAHASSRSDCSTENVNAAGGGQVP